MEDNDIKKNKKDNLILLKSLKDGSKEIKDMELSEDENELKNKLINIENKLESMENVILAVKQQKPDTMFDIDIFTTIVGSIAISAAIEIIAEYFGLDSADIDSLLK